MVIFQSVLLLFGLFVCPLSESRSVCYIKCMPEIKHYSCLIAEAVFPVLIFVLCLWGMLAVPKEDGGDRLHLGAPYLFVLLNQVSILAWFFSDFYANFAYVYGLWIEERIVVLMIKASIENLPSDAYSSAIGGASQVKVADIDPAADAYHKVEGSGKERDMVDCKLDAAFFEQLKNGLQDDDPDQYYKKKAEKMIDEKFVKPFSEAQRERSEFDGPATLG